jgi:hypothetical protein
MTKSELIRQYRDMSAEDRRTFDRWLRANGVIASVFAAAFVAMAMAATNTTGPSQALAQNIEAAKLGAAERQAERSVSPHQLTVRFAPHQLPLQQVDEPF